VKRFIARSRARVGWCEFSAISRFTAWNEITGTTTAAA
jgi:hypothetical protein